MLENTFHFKYLSTIFVADAKQKYDIKVRIAKVFARCGTLRNVFDSKELPIKLKLRLYKAAVCSILTYGCETWRITPPVMRQINGANSRMLSRLTGKSIPQETRPPNHMFVQPGQGDKKAQVKVVGRHPKDGT